MMETYEGFSLVYQYCGKCGIRESDVKRQFDKKFLEEEFPQLFKKDEQLDFTEILEDDHLLIEDGYGLPPPPAEPIDKDIKTDDDGLPNRIPVWYNKFLTGLEQEQELKTLLMRMWGKWDSD